MTQQFFELNTPEFEAPEEQKPFSVSDLNRRVRGCLESQFDLIWVQGEISNFKAHSSGHWYFSLKDSKSQVAAVMFKGSNSRMKFVPENGAEVLVRGRITVYEPRGNYQVFCESMEPVGAGALQKQFEQLKAKLKAEGLFDSSRKRPLPRLPKKIAVVTSPTGAAIKDILQVLARRFPGLEVLVVPTIVQGTSAAAQICKAFEKASRVKDLDAIIVGRGGGSIEDLWCFNDENLARLIASSPVPVISAIGHEIDFTISDFVADYRAPTPSAAAEVVSANAMELSQALVQRQERMHRAVRRQIEDLWQKVDHYKRLLVDPQKHLQQARSRLGDLSRRLQFALRSSLKGSRSLIKSHQLRLPRPTRLIEARRARVEAHAAKLTHNQKTKLAKVRHRLEQQMSVLDAMSPLRVVDRGYSIAESQGHVVKSIRAVTAGDSLNVRVSDGIIQTQVLETKALPNERSDF